jgi:hypothetical protein
MDVKNPNAIVGGGSALVVGQIVLNVAKAIGWDLSSGWALALGAGITSVVLFIGRNGFVGVWRVLKFGTGNSTPPVAKP